MTLFLSVITFCNAQEKQNDATIDETINWINEYGFDNTIALDDMLKSPEDIRYRTEKDELHYYYKNKDGNWNTVILKNTITNTIIVSKSNGHYEIYIEDLEARKFYDPTNSSLGTLNFGSNKEYAQKTYKAFEHLFYLLKWEVECINKLVDENKF